MSFCLVSVSAVFCFVIFFVCLFGTIAAPNGGTIRTPIILFPLQIITNKKSTFSIRDGVLFVNARERFV